MRHSTVKALILAAVAMLGSLPSASAALIGHWTLDNNTTGLQNLGTTGAASNLAAATPLGAITGGPTFTPTGGAMGGYASFSGTQALIGDLAGNAAEMLTDYPFTLAAWIRASDTPVERGAVVGLINRNSNSQYMSMGTETAAEGLDFQAVRRNTSFIGTEASGTMATITDGDWHHIAAVYAATDSLQLYLDGNPVGQSTVAVNFDDGINTIGIGAMRRAAGFIDRYTGDVDDVRMYDSALSRDQIRSLIPEPATLALAAIAACGAAILCRRRSMRNGHRSHRTI